MPKHLVETATLTAEAAAAAKKSGRMLVQLISPGWGSSGYYAPNVLEQAVTDNIIPAGTHMYADHATETEAMERPGRSIKDLMSVTREDARLATDDEVGDGLADPGALVAEVQVVPAWRELVEAVADDIGVSIRGDATDLVMGEAEGRSGRIVEGLAHVQSVDWVTRAGRGGRVLQVLESAAVNGRALDRGIAEATVNDTREQLQDLLRGEYGGDRTNVWVQDFDESTVWFTVETGDESGTWQQAYDGDDAVSLSGDRVEVRRVTKYVPVSSGASSPGDTSTKEDAIVPATRPGSTNNPESKEDTMPKKEIEESEYNRLVEADGRVSTLESERAAEKARADKAEEALAESQRRGAAMDLIRDHSHTFTALEAKGLVADLPLTEGGDLDAEAFGTQLDEHAAQAKADGGAGRVSGFGATTDQSVQESTPTRTTSAWGRPLTEQKGA